MDDLHYRDTVTPTDVKTVREIVTSTGFFYPVEIDVAAELAEEKARDGAGSSYRFLFAETGGRPVAYTCYGLIPGSEHSYDLYWIATHHDFRGLGIGTRLLEETHRRIRAAGGVNVVAETSSLDKYLPTRAFYLRMGYAETGRIADFYRMGDGKVTFVKRL